MPTNTRSSRALSLGIVPAALFTACVAGCGGDDTGGGGSTTSTPDNPDVVAGLTAVVAILNPVPNAGHNTGVPAEAGDQRNAITVDAEPGQQDVTADGIGVVEVPSGPLDLHIGPALLPLTVQAEGDVYDAPIAYNGSGAAFFANTPIRYPVGEVSGALFFDPVDPLADIEVSLGTDLTIVVLGKGIYKGNLELPGKGVLLYGEGFTEHDVIIDGSVVVEGSEVRIRGVTITGDLSAKGNDFGISFSVVKGTTSITGNGGAFVRNVFCGTTTVPSSNATLLDNFGVEPLTTLPLGVCD